MMTFSRWDVVAVPFPYVERRRSKRRPALIVSGRRWLDAHNLLWVMMITSAANRPRTDDIAVDDLSRAGLPRPSVIRPSKIATVEATRCERIGQVSDTLRNRIESVLRLGLA